MPIANTYLEALPYIDAEPTAAERAAAEALILAEISPENQPSPTRSTPLTHPSLSPPIPLALSPLMSAEISRSAASPRTPLSAIDLSRYESPSQPSADTSLEESTAVLARAYAAHSYMLSRAVHLDLLDSHGKNAWLVGNWHLEAELKTLERELARVNREVDLITLARSGAQKDVEAEMKMLEEAWQKGISKTIETQVATAQLRAEILETMRMQTRQ
ncbi:hypothetical protein CFIMG_004515RA [Ceratocystis fimbriata CBS 114723]|uniref:Pre-mRNA-splicing factor SPF27 n=1 Tax=Ceratocystis fimbriata CBS 114723 TaxID=1035309 RepID=A0A2C5WXA6_9PEZI|nr:hypothetical protein CFIMG_004515RA [Ceratocystis fimbriata CBS 114723]